MAELHFYDKVIESVTPEGVRVNMGNLGEIADSISDYAVKHPHEEIELYGNRLEIALALELCVRAAEKRNTSAEGDFMEKKFKAMRDRWSEEAGEQVKDDDIPTLKQTAEAMVKALIDQEGAEAE